MADVVRLLGFAQKRFNVLAERSRRGGGARLQRVCRSERIVQLIEAAMQCVIRPRPIDGARTTWRLLANELRPCSRPSVDLRHKRLGLFAWFDQLADAMFEQLRPFEPREHRFRTAEFVVAVIEQRQLAEQLGRAWKVYPRAALVGENAAVELEFRKRIQPPRQPSAIEPRECRERLFPITQQARNPRRAIIAQALRVALGCRKVNGLRAHDTRIDR